MANTGRKEKNGKSQCDVQAAEHKFKIDTAQKLIPNERPSRNSNAKAVQMPACRTAVRKESFYPRTIREWNALPTATVLAPSLESFKTRLRQ